MGSLRSSIAFTLRLRVARWEGHFRSQRQSDEPRLPVRTLSGIGARHACWAHFKDELRRWAERS